MSCLPGSPYNLAMLIKKASDIRSSEITPKSLYLRRREFIQASAAGLVAAGFAACWRRSRRAGRRVCPSCANVKKSPLSTTEAPSSYEHITSYNNFYEFAPGAGDGPKQNSKNFKPTPWTIEVDGEVATSRPTTSSRTSSSRSRSKSASTASAASKRGRWSSRGSAFR